ncbi:MAG TPA: hypothetical protein VER17_19905, partial [Tepidisphaeraceae bacterium]|nr:hypothetical protein [Tepidisphaeraceae bacterium]
MSSDDREIGDTGDAGGSNGGTRLKGPGAGEADGPAAGGPGGAARPGGASGPEGVAPGTGGVALLCDAGGRVTRLVRHALPGWS